MILSNTTITVTTPGKSTVSRGRSTPGTPTLTTMDVSWQPARPSLMQTLPEGRQQLKTFEIYSESPLQTADVEGGRNPALVTCPICPGETYEVYRCDPWVDDIVGNYHSVVQLVHEP